MTQSRPLLALGFSGLLAAALGAIFFARAVHAQDEGGSEPTPKPRANSSELPDLQPNQDWQSVAVASEAGLQGRAWSDPAAGCHLAVFSLPIPDTSASDKIFESLALTLAKSDYKLSKTERDLQPPQLILEGFGVRGIASLLVPEGTGRNASLLACYWNGREPTYCRSICQRADEKMRAETSSATTGLKP